MRRQGGRGEVHYYSPRLKKKLQWIDESPATLVEAPSGYGKTTAVRDYLQAKAERGIPVHWFAATEEMPSSGFRRLALLFAKIDEEAGQRLLGLGLPSDATLGEACDCLRLLSCGHPTYLVIDNYHLLQDALPPSFFLALLEHGGRGLHIVILTQMLTKAMRKALSGRGCPLIGILDLRLGAPDIKRYYKLSGVDITREQSSVIEQYTEGWVIAVYLQLRSYREGGVLGDTRGIAELMEYLVWDRLGEDQKTFLLRLSPFSTFTLAQASSLASISSLPDDLMSVLEGPFIRYWPLEGRYEIHGILSGLLRQKRRERGPAFHRDCLLAAGDWCRDAGRTTEALGYYWEARDYERILSLDLLRMVADTVAGTPFSHIAKDIREKCPPSIWARHPLSMLGVAYSLLLAGMDEEFGTLLHEMKPIVSGSEAGASRLLGEWTLLSSFLAYPDLPSMTNVLRAAAPLLGPKPSQVILPSSPWCFGTHSALHSFHRKIGGAEKEADDLEQYISLYSRLTGGHGCGADHLFRAELAYQRGETALAEISAYKASFSAEGKDQSVIRLGSALVLGHIALQKDDPAGWNDAVRSMERAASRPDSPVLRSAFDSVRGVLLTELQVPDGLPEWLKEGSFAHRGLPWPIEDNAIFVHGMYLRLKGEAAKLIGFLESKMERMSASPFCHMLTLLLLASGYMDSGDEDRAAHMVERAIDIGVPDGLLSPIMSFSWVLHGLPDGLLAKKHPHLMKEYRALKERFGRGWFSLHKKMPGGDLPKDLTGRELEVARLAAQGLRNKEIADELVVSEATVRAHLRTVFQKLDIDRRAKLAEKLITPQK